MPAPDPTRVAILGASGFAGGELVRLLDDHPSARVAYLGAGGSAGRTLGEVHPHLAATALGGDVLGPLETEAVLDAGVEIALLALPHGTSARLAPPLLEASVRVVDLSGGFRLPAEAYPSWYGFEHPAPPWLDKAVYGLPELFRGQIAGAAIVANPGCYPTAVGLGLAPLIAAGVIDPDGIVVDGKTGISGAGKGPTDVASFSVADESIRPYRFPGHRHTPEMERALELATGVPARVAFAPHLVPVVRGVLVTCYARSSRGLTAEGASGVLADAYAGEPFVRVLPPGAMADTKRTRGSNLVELQATSDPRTGTAIVVGALDNLVKGAAGQAIQNLNLLLGVDETTALPRTAVYP